MWLEALPSSEEGSCGCPTCGAAVKRKTYGEMHAGAYLLDGVRTEIIRTPQDLYSDAIVLDDLTQYFDGKLYRLWPSESYFSCGSGRLHRKAWEDAFGPLPAGCHVHHRDGNRHNNSLANLECLPASEHMSLSGKSGGYPSHKTAREPFNAAARQNAKAWNQSEAGRLFHKRNSEKMQNWTKWKREPKVCPHCEATYDAVVRKQGHQQIYCSTACRVNAYRKRDAEKKGQ